MDMKTTNRKDHSTFRDYVVIDRMALGENQGDNDKPILKERNS